MHKRIIEILKKQTTINDKEYFFHDNWVIPFQNGYYDVKDNIFRNIHDLNFFYCIPHDFKHDKSYKCPNFKKALADWLEGHNDITPNDIFEIMGYCMMMNTNLKRAFFFFGVQDSGKTTFQNLFLHIIGKDNRCNISLDRMTRNEFGTDGMQLKILNMVGDHGSEEIKHAGMFKEWVGGDEEMAVEGKGKPKGKFINHCKGIFAGNKLPRITDDDEAFYSKWILINFGNTFKRTRDPYAKYLISDPNEVQGIIHECLNAVKQLYLRGDFRKEIRNNIAHIWKYNSDNLYRFIHDNCVIGAEYSVNKKEFIRQYIKDVFNSKVGTPLVSRTLTKKLLSYNVLEERPYINKVQTKVYAGIGFKTSEDKKIDAVIETFAKMNQLDELEYYEPEQPNYSADPGLDLIIPPNQDFDYEEPERQTFEQWVADQQSLREYERQLVLEERKLRALKQNERDKNE